MANLLISDSQAESRDQEFRNEFLKWKGYYDAVPPLRAAINAIADATTASWATKGVNGKAMKDIINQFDGNGKQTFKMVMNNACKSFLLSGDAYLEVVTNRELGIDNLVLLPPDNISVIIKNGRIKRYEEITGSARWKPQQLVHFAYNPVGAMCHGTSTVEPLENMLINLNQLWDDMGKLFHRYIKPVTMIGLSTDDPTEIESFKREWTKIKNIPESDLILPSELVDKVERVAVPQGSTLDPHKWEQLLVERILQSTRVPDLALGTGTVNSEESAKMKYSGFRQQVRFIQQFMEDSIQFQLFPQAFPEDTPTIEFSFAAEPQEEKFNRLMQSVTTVNATDLNDEIKGLTMLKILQEAGVIEDE